MPLNSTQHYSHTELTDFCETFLLIFNCCRRRRGGEGNLHARHLCLLHICSEVNKKGYWSEGVGRGGTTPPNLLIINTGDGKETDVFPVHQQCLNCQSEISVKFLLFFFISFYQRNVSWSIPDALAVQASQSAEQHFFSFWSIKSGYFRVQIASAFRWDVQVVCMHVCVMISYLCVLKCAPCVFSRIH